MTELFPSPPVDELTHYLCMRHGLVSVEDLEARVYRLRDAEVWFRGQRRATYVLTAEELPAKYWHGDIPVLEVTLTGLEGPQVLVGRMDVTEVKWSYDVAGGVRSAWEALTAPEVPPKTYHAAKVPLEFGLSRTRPKTRGWQQWSRHLAKQVEKHRPAWYAYLEWKADRERAEEAAREAQAIAEAEADEGLTSFRGPEINHPSRF